LSFYVFAILATSSDFSESQNYFLEYAQFLDRKFSQFKSRGGELKEAHELEEFQRDFNATITNYCIAVQHTNDYAFKVRMTDFYYYYLQIYLFMIANLFCCCCCCSLIFVVICRDVLVCLIVCSSI
jgi:hypothetical protein